MNIPFIKKQIGFTLVELLVVMLILTALASVTLDFTKDFAFQGRYEVTKDRYEKIKRAIIGRPDVLINGQPDISGFVADMGRLPRNIQELLVQNYCMPDYKISEANPSIPSAHAGNYKTWCETDYAAAPIKWVPQSTGSDCSVGTTNATQATCEAASGIWTGWKGPYLTLQKPDYEPNAFSDGWGSQATGLTDHNYGWNIVHRDSTPADVTTINTVLADISDATQLAVQSYGKDGAPAGSDYDEDYPADPIAVTANQWQVTIDNNVTVNIAPPNSGYCNDSVCSNPSYGATIAACENTKKATWIVGSCTDAGGNFISHTQVSCTSPLVWAGVAVDVGICSDPTVTTQAACVSPDTWTIGACNDQSYTTLAACTAPVGTLISPACSDGTSPDKTICEAVPAIWSTASEFNCKNGGGAWVNLPQEICIKINFGLDTAYSTTTSSPVTPVTPVMVNEDGLMQTFTFSSFKKLSDNGVMSAIPSGYYDVGIYQYDTTATPPACTAISYPSDKNRKVYFVPNSSIPVINW